MLCKQVLSLSLRGRLLVVSFPDFKKADLRHFYFFLIVEYHFGKIIENLVLLNDKYGYMKLIETYANSGYKFQIIEKGKSTAIFKGENIHGSISYEVHKLRIAKEASYTIAGKTIDLPEREKIASTEDFGTYGFSYSDYSLAYSKFLELELN